MDVKFMPYNGKYARQTSQRPKWPLVLLILLIIGCAFVAFALFSNGSAPPKADNPQVENLSAAATELPNWLNATQNTTRTTEPIENTTPPEPVFYTASIGSMGDLLMHKPVFDSQYSAAVYQNGIYNFDSIFQYIKEDISALDYAIVNLETTLASNTNYPYSGYPNFNCPDEVVDGVKAAGFDMMLTANNHSYDTGITGYKRTVNVISEKGLETLGTYDTPDSTKWTVQNINNVNVGMLCYTYATSETNGRPALNGGSPIKEAGLCNYFTYENLDKFYAEVEGYLAEMKEAGADATMLFIHWGEEYQLSENATQQKMAQKLCNLGIDVIVGGHPHVVQPIDLLESTEDPEHKTVCLYSMGNAVSNQRQGAISAINTAHTEDGVLFSVEFTKYEGGETYVSGVSVTPTWVNMFTNENKRREYNILPLNRDSVDSWQEDFDLSDATYNKAKESFDRTMDIVGEGLKEVQNYIDSYVPDTGAPAALFSMARNARTEN